MKGGKKLWHGVYSDLNLRRTGKRSKSNKSRTFLYSQFLISHRTLQQGSEIICTLSFGISQNSRGVRAAEGDPASYEK